MTKIRAVVAHDIIESGDTTHDGARENAEGRVGTVVVRCEQKKKNCACESFRARAPLAGRFVRPGET